MTIADIMRKNHLGCPELDALFAAKMDAIRAEEHRAAMVTEAKLLDFLCSGAMLRDLSLVQDYDPHRFDEPWRPQAPLRIR